MEFPHVTRRELGTKLRQVKLSNNGLVIRAIDHARYVHKDEIRLYTGNSVLKEHIHPVTVDVIDYMLQIGKQPTPEITAETLLHDAFEEYWRFNYQIFKKVFGDFGDTGKRVFEVLRYLRKRSIIHFDRSRRPWVARAVHHFKKLAKAPEDAKIITLADRLNNLSCIDLDTGNGVPPRSVLERWIYETERFYLPLARIVSAPYFERLEQRVAYLKPNSL